MVRCLPAVKLRRSVLVLMLVPVLRRAQGVLKTTSSSKLTNLALLFLRRIFPTSLV